MPSWLISIIVGAIMKFAVPLLINEGLPALEAWLKQRFPWLPVDAIAQIIQKLIGNAQAAAVTNGAGTPEYHAAVQQHLAQATKDLHAVCSGVACPPETKSLD